MPVRVWFVGVCVLLGAGPGAAYDVVSLEDPGRISGRVRLEGERPERGFLPVLKNADVCGDRVPDDGLVVSGEGGVGGVVVELAGVTSGKALPRDRATLDNRNCAFVPRVQALVVGQGLEIFNSDPILHDAHAWLGPRTIFNLGLPPWRRVTHVFSEPGLHSIDCNVLHTWMKAWVFVAEHPYVVVSGPDGGFVLDDVPPGTYDLRLWHERLGEKSVPVTVRPARSVAVDVTMRQGPEHDESERGRAPGATGDASRAPWRRTEGSVGDGEVGHE